MLKNKQGSLLVDAMMALLLVGVCALMLSSALQVYQRMQETERRMPYEHTIPSWYEEAGRIYDD